MGVNLIAADTDEKAQYLATSMQQQFLNIRQGKMTQFSPPIEDIHAVWSPFEQEAVAQQSQAPSVIIGSPETVKRKLEEFVEMTKADELIISSGIFDHEERLRSYEILSEIMKVKEKHRPSRKNLLGRCFFLIVLQSLLSDSQFHRLTHRYMRSYRATVCPL